VSNLLRAIVLFALVLPSGCERASKQSADQPPSIQQEPARSNDSGRVPFMVESMRRSDTDVTKDNSDSLDERDPRRYLIQTLCNKPIGDCVVLGGRLRLDDGTRRFFLVNYRLTQVISIWPAIFTIESEWDEWVSNLEWLLDHGIKIRVLLLDVPETRSSRFSPLIAEEIDKLESLRSRYPNLVLVSDK
jgi:hypothetical protein